MNASGTRSKSVFDPVHYLALLERKPGILDYACGRWPDWSCRSASPSFGAGWKPNARVMAPASTSGCCACWKIIPAARQLRPGGGEGAHGSGAMTLDAHRAVPHPPTPVASHRLPARRPSPSARGQDRQSRCAGVPRVAGLGGRCGHEPRGTSTLLLASPPSSLKLPTMLRDYAAVAAACGQERVDYAGFLLRLAERELLERERKATERRLKEAGVPGSQAPSTPSTSPPGPRSTRPWCGNSLRGEYIERRKGKRTAGWQPRHGQDPPGHRPGLCRSHGTGRRVRFTSTTALVDPAS